MKTISPRVALERCQTFINCQLKANGEPATKSESKTFRTVTISRQAGCGAMAVAEALAELLGSERVQEAAPWTVFDRNLMDKVLEEHELPKRLARFLPEDWTSEIQGTLDELFGLHPPASIMVKQTAETILGLAKLGNVILIGRAANVVTAKLEDVCHVRLVAPLESRIRQIQQIDQLCPRAALDFIRREDRGRKRYLKKYYGKDVNDPLLYHLTINTGLVGYENTARMIAEYVKQKLGVKAVPDSL